MSFVHLHVHDEYSTLDGINRTEQLPEYIKSCGMNACAQTNHGNVAGTYAFWKACKKSSIKPILGIEAYYCVGDRSARECDADGEKYYHLILLARNNNGLKNLFKLSSRSYSEGFYFKPRIDDALLAEHSEDILATTSCLGSRFSQLILKNRTPEAERLLEHHKQIFKDRFFIELQLHQCPEQQLVNQTLLGLARKYNIPAILTNDAHYTHQSDKQLHEEALCIQTKSVMSSSKRFSFGDLDVHVGSPEWMISKAKEQGLPDDCISNTLVIADMIQEDYFCDVKNHYTKFPWIPEGVNASAYLKELSLQGLSKRFSDEIPSEYLIRLHDELNAIEFMGFDHYMLVVWDIVNIAAQHNITVGPGRGCLTGDALVYTSRGLIALKDVQVNDFVVSHTGELRKVTNRFKYEICEPILRISTTSQDKPIQLTKDHKVYAEKRKLTTTYENELDAYKRSKMLKYEKVQYAPSFIPAQNLSVGDLIWTSWPKESFHTFEMSQLDLSNYLSNKPYVHIEDSKIQILNPLTNQISKEYPRFIDCTADFYYMLGLWIGDGWYRVGSNNSIGWAFNSKDEAQINKCKIIVESWGFTVSLRKHKQKHLVQMFVYGMPLAYCFQALFPDYRSTSRTKYIGNFRYLSNEYRLAILNGLIDSDGHRAPDGRIKITSVSKRLINELREMLLLMHIVPQSTVYRESFMRGAFLCNEAYSLCFRFQSINSNTEGYYSVIQKIEDVQYKGSVYDISVEKDSSYLTSNYAVHNSAAGSLVAYALGITQIDPIKYKLLFSRFLNIGRASTPVFFTPEMLQQIQ